MAVCHLHQQVSNKNTGFRQNNDCYWPFLADRLREHHVQVLMGDFNMSLFKVVPELRSRGVPVQLAAWYPWRVYGSEEPMADSCGIFMCVPATVTPQITANLFEEPWQTLDMHDANGGPGQTLKTFLPKAQENTAKLRDTFAAVVAERDNAAVAAGDGQGNQDKAVVDERDNAAVAAGDGQGNKGKGKGKGKRGRTPNQRTCLTVREKRLDPEIWRYQGTVHKGSHFPLAAFTNNVGRRSEERYLACAKGRGW